MLGQGCIVRGVIYEVSQRHANIGWTSVLVGVTARRVLKGRRGGGDDPVMTWGCHGFVTQARAYTLSTFVTSDKKSAIRRC